MQLLNDDKYAVLIDADNISHKYIKIILDEVANYGVATYKRIYGDWTQPRLSSWRDVMMDNSLVPIQQYSYTVGKNATDSAMIIDAMDILYSGNVTGFCIISSDSDFTRLVVRLRESGMHVVGMGESKTPRPFIAACNSFKYLDILYSNAQKSQNRTQKKSPKGQAAADAVKSTAVRVMPQETLRNSPVGQPPQKPRQKEKEAEKDPAPPTEFDEILDAMLDIIDENSEEDGWILLADLGNTIAKRFPDFDVRNYGYKKLSSLVEDMDDFKVRRTQAAGNPNVQVVYVRNAAD